MAGWQIAIGAATLQSVRSDEFTESAPGRLVPIGGGFAFVPAPLPPRIEPSWEVMRQVDAATRALARLAGQARILPNPDLLVRPLLTREAVESNRIEGTHTLVADVLVQQAAGPPRDPRRAADNLEVIRYIETARLARRWLEDGRPLTPFLVRALHAELLRETRGDHADAGAFRRRQVLIGQDGDSPETARFVPPPPELVPDAMDNLMAFVVEGEEFPPLVTAAVAHYQFESIHPFEDGNGRLGRLLIPIELMARGVLDTPLINLSPFFEARREQYLAHLKRVSTEGAWQAWLAFFLQAVETQAEDGRQRANTLLSTSDEYRRVVRDRSRSRTPLLAVDLIMERVVVSVPALAEFAHCEYNTARSAVGVLQSLGILEPLPGTYPQLWVAREVLHRVYED